MKYIEEYRPFGTLSNIETLDHTANVSPWPGPWSNFLQKARENGLVTPSSLSPFVFVVIFPFVALQIEDKGTKQK